MITTSASVARPPATWTKSARASCNPRRSAVAHASLLDEHGRYRKPEHREPDDSGKDEDGDEERHGQEHDDGDEVRHDPVPRPDVDTCDEPDREHVAERDQQSGEREERDASVTGRARPHERVRDDDRNAERERTPELRGVRAHRLADELADRALGRRKWRRQRSVRPLRPRTPRHARRLLSDRFEHAWDRVGEGFERAPDPPARSVALGDLVRDRPDLDRGDARLSRTPAARRTPPWPRLGTRRMWPRRTEPLVPIDRTSASGSAARTFSSSSESGSTRSIDRDLGGDVAVDGLAADHETAGRDSSATCNADVHDSGGRARRELTRGRGRSLDRPDAACEPRVVAELDAPSRRRGAPRRFLLMLRSYDAIGLELEDGMLRGLREPLVVRRVERDGEERARDPAQAVVLPQDGHGRVGVELHDGQAFAAPAAAAARPSRRLARSSPSCGRRTERRASGGRPPARSTPGSTTASRSSVPEPSARTFAAPQARAAQEGERAALSARLHSALPVGLGRRRHP